MQILAEGDFTPYTNQNKQSAEFLSISKRFPCLIAIAILTENKNNKQASRKESTQYRAEKKNSVDFVERKLCFFEIIEIGIN